MELNRAPTEKARSMTEHPVVAKRKLIEVALPLDAINESARKEKNNPFLKGHPRSMHLWWSPKPLAAARGLLFAQLVDDPSSNPDRFPTAEDQTRERGRLFKLMSELVKWENSGNETILDAAVEEILNSWHQACETNKGHPEAPTLFDVDRLPPLADPFAGGGAIPLEAQRLGLESHASDLNPVAVTITKAKIEIPPVFGDCPPVNPTAQGERRLVAQTFTGAKGLAADLRYYAALVRDKAGRRVRHLYPTIAVTASLVDEKPELEGLAGGTITPIAWVWARTVNCPDPAFAGVDVPLVSTFVLSEDKGNGSYVEPRLVDGTCKYIVRHGVITDLIRAGTKVGRAHFRCPLSNAPISNDYVKAEAQAGRMGIRLMAIVAQGEKRGRVYLSATPEDEALATNVALPDWRPEGDVPAKLTGGTCVPYGLDEWWKLYTNRQLVVLDTLAGLQEETRETVERDAVTAGLVDDGVPLRDGGQGAKAYSDAIAVYLALTLSKLADYSSTVATWNWSNENVRHTFTGQAIPMNWGFAEASLLDHGLSFTSVANTVARALELLPSKVRGGKAAQVDGACWSGDGRRSIVQTDPPYFNNVSFAALSDYFYVWLRRMLAPIYPELFSTMSVPKTEELIMASHRHSGRDEAGQFFVNGMRAALANIGRECHPSYPIAIYYAYKQSDRVAQSIEGSGWEVFLEAIVGSGLQIVGTWPVRTERGSRTFALGTNALASSVVLVCRPRSNENLATTRSEFLERLCAELPLAVRQLRDANIAPVDLAQAAIGPGMRSFTEYRNVLSADGSEMSVRDALQIINGVVDEVLSEHDIDVEADTRWATTWFELYGFEEGDFGVAEQLTKAKVTTPDGLVEAGVIESRRGKVRLYRPAELDSEWDPQIDRRPTVWEMTHHLIRLLESEGEPAAAELAASLGAQAETARDLAYRLYVISDRKKRAEDARQYNGLVQSWSEIMRLAQLPSSTARQAGLEFAEE